MKYDYLVVGTGLYGATFAHEATAAGKRVLVIDRRPHIAGLAYTEPVEGIEIHRYGPHIFHTDDTALWEYVTRLVPFRPYIHTPVADYHGQRYSLPFNMHTFRQMWGVTTPAEAAARIAQQRRTAGISQPRNLEEQAISLVGVDIYEKLIRGYTEKQWGRPCRELPAFIIRRLPVRLTYDNNYFGYQLGTLEYRAVRFETEILDIPDFQGHAVINYTDRETPYTRVIEHKWFGKGGQPKTVISREYSAAWRPGCEPHYPVNDAANDALYAAYRRLADREPQVIFGGRLGEYRYYDMDAVIAAALAKSRQELA